MRMRFVPQVLALALAAAAPVLAQQPTDYSTVEIKSE